MKNHIYLILTFEILFQREIVAAILKEVHQTIKAKQIRVFPSKEKERDENDKRPPRVELNPPKV